MKKFKIFAFASIAIMIAVVIGAFGVSAQSTEVSTVDDFIAAVETGGKIKLMSDIQLGEFTGKRVTIAVGTEVELNLNGYEISGTATDENVASTLIQNNGTLIVSDSSEAGTGKITLSDSNVRLYTWGKGFFTINNEGTLVVNGGTIENTGGTDVPYAIDNNTTSRNATVTINGGQIVAKNAAMRAFCNSTTNENKIIINNGTITSGTSAIWISQVNKKANKGYLEINGGTIQGTNNGAYVSVFDQSLMSNMSVKITGGTIKNNSETNAAFTYEYWSSESDLANGVLNLDITGGTFINENENGRAFYNPDFLEIPVTYTNIAGGTYTTDISEYVAEGYVSRLIGDMYTVGVEYDVNVTEVSNGTVSVDKTKALTGETVTLTVTPDAEYEVSSVKVMDAENNIIEVTNNAFVMPTSEVTVTVELALKKYVVNTNGLTNGEFTVDKTEAAKGETVTVTVTPDAEYELDKIVVVDENDTEVTVTDGTFTMPSGDVTVSVQLKQIEYIVEVTDFNNGTVSVDKDVAVKGETVTITATPEEGYEVSSVKVVDYADNEVSVVSGQFTMPGKGVTVTVEFAKIEYTVNVTELENGTITVDKSKATLLDEVTVTVTPDAGYELNGIIVLDENGTDVAGADGKFTMPASNVTVSATLVDIRHTVKTSALSHGTITVDKPEADRGDTVTITVTPDAEYKLVSFKVVDADGTEVTVTDGKFEMPNSEVTVSAELAQIKYAVNVTQPTNGTVEVGKEEAAKGEAVTITAIIPDEGYELSSVKVVDKDNKEVTLTNDTFTMPSGEVTVSVELTEISYTTEVTPVDPTEEVEEVEVGVKESEELNDVLLDSLTEMLKEEDEETQELASIVGTNSTKVEVEISKIDEETIDEEVVEEMQEVAGTAKIATFFDINVLIKHAKEDVVIGTIDTLTKEIELVIVLPEELKNADKDVNRTYFIVRKHGTKVDTIPATLSEDGNHLVFKSKEFSTYALAYEDKATTPNPDTYDGIGLYVVLGSLSLVALVGISVLTKKKKLFN